MGKTLILAVHPVWKDYSSDEFDYHLQEVFKKCQGNLVGYTTMDDIVYYNDSYLQDEDDVYGDYTAFSSGNISGRIEPYWGNLIQALERDGFYPDYFGGYNPPGTEKNNSSKFIQVEENYEEARLAFHNLFSVPRKLRKEVVRNEYDVLITDMHIGRYLHRTYRDDFNILYLHPEVLDLNFTLRLIDEHIEDFNFFQKWHKREEPTVIGNWLAKRHDPGYGKFQLYAFSKESKDDLVKMVPTEGVISDRYGLAWFKGSINKHTLQFEKHYFHFATQNIANWDNRVIHYRILRGTGMGVYWVKENVENECTVEFG